jgi:UDP-N-acetylglucosamine acyltransferase
MPRISPQAAVDSKAVLADDVEIGPFCVVGPHVKLGPGCRLINHVVIQGRTTAGRNNVFYPYCVIGGDPQDLKYSGGETRLELGDGNSIREHVTIHIGTEKGGGVTRVGNNNLLMINCHVAHDVQIGNFCILANNVMLAGHVVVGDRVNMGGSVGVHHFVTIGELAFIGGLTRIRKDVPPFVKIDDRERVRALNTEGLKRAKFADADIVALKAACRRLFGRRSPMATVMNLFAKEDGVNPHVKKLLDFLHRRDLGVHGRYLEGQRSAAALKPPALR